MTSVLAKALTWTPGRRLQRTPPDMAPAWSSRVRWRPENAPASPSPAPTPAWPRRQPLCSGLRLLCPRYSPRAPPAAAHASYIYSADRLEKKKERESETWKERPKNRGGILWKKRNNTAGQIAGYFWGLFIILPLCPPVLQCCSEGDSVGRPAGRDPLQWARKGLKQEVEERRKKGKERVIQGATSSSRTDSRSINGYWSANTVNTTKAFFISLHSYSKLGVASMYPAGSNSVTKIQTSIVAVNSRSVLVPPLLHLQPSHVIEFRENNGLSQGTGWRDVDIFITVTTWSIPSPRCAAQHFMGTWPNSLPSPEASARCVILFLSSLLSPFLFSHSGLKAWLCALPATARSLFIWTPRLGPTIMGDSHRLTRCHLLFYCIPSPQPASDCLFV